MANKNTAGNTLRNFKNRESRLINIIDKRDEKGANDNTDNAFNDYTLTANGERVWSY